MYLNTRSFIGGLIVLMAFVLLAMVLTSCSPSTHLNVARPSIEGERLIDTDVCWEWTGIDGPCVSDSQSLDAPEFVSIETWTVGRLQPYAVVCDSWGLKWTDTEGNPVSISDMKDGEFYLFTRSEGAESAGFNLCK